MAQPLISIIVPNYQGKGVFPACIRSLLVQTYENFQIVFVDDSSTDGSRELAQELFGQERRVTLTRTRQNSGYTGACNQGLRVCRGAYVIVTNNDATFKRNWLEEMYAIVRGKKNVIGASNIIEPNTKAWRDAIPRGDFLTLSLCGTFVERRLLAMEKRAQLYELFASGVLIIPRTALGDEIFPQDYFAYCEDIELCWRLRMRGYRVVFNDRAHMRHLGSYTKKRVAGFSKRAAMNSAKNRLVNVLTLYEMKNVCKLLPPFLFLEAGVLLATPRLLGARLRGYWWVCTHLRKIMEQRRDRQRARMVSDESLMGLLSYKIADELFVRSYARPVVRFANACMRVYCRVLRIRTFDLSTGGEPAIDPAAVARR